MLDNPWSAVGNPTSALGPSGSSFCPSGLVPLGIHHLLLSNLTTVIFHFITLVCGFQNVTGRRQRPIVGHVRHSRRRRPVDSPSCLMNNCLFLQRLCLRLTANLGQYLCLRVTYLCSKYAQYDKRLIIAS